MRFSFFSDRIQYNSEFLIVNFECKNIPEPLRRDGAKGFIYFRIGVTDQEKNHALTGREVMNVQHRTSNVQRRMKKGGDLRDVLNF